jgi:hypothetical protein
MKRVTKAVLSPAVSVGRLTFAERMLACDEDRLDVRAAYAVRAMPEVL